MTERDSELNHDGLNIIFKVTSGNEKVLPPSEGVTNEFAWELVTSEDDCIFGNIGCDGDIRGTFVEIKMVSLKVMVFVLVEVRDFNSVHCLNDPVEIDVLSLLYDVNVHWSLESWFGAGETVNFFGASDGKSGKFETHGDLIYYMYFHYWVHKA